MKKRQIALLALLAWQAVSTYSKDEEARKDLVETPGLLGKLQKVGKKLRDTNKATFEKLKDTDREEAASSLKQDATHDAEQAKARIDENKNADWAAKGKDAARSITDGVTTLIDKAPDQKALAEHAEKYTTQLKDRWNKL
jgi:hypothetical protein